MSFLMFSTVAGILMALFLDNVGGAWDNAKKVRVVRSRAHLLQAQRSNHRRQLHATNNAITSFTRMLAQSITH